MTATAAGATKGAVAGGGRVDGRGGSGGPPGAVGASRQPLAAGKAAAERHSRGGSRVVGGVAPPAAPQFLVGGEGGGRRLTAATPRARRARRARGASCPPAMGVATLQLGRWGGGGAPADAQRSTLSLATDIGHWCWNPSVLGHQRQSSISNGKQKHGQRYLQHTHLSSRFTFGIDDS